jgi:hypothetical protein
LASRSPFRVAFLLFALGSGLAQAVACGDGGAAGGEGARAGGGAGALPDAAVGSADSEAPAATMRLAHVAQGLGPVDFCYRTASSTSFEGPVLGGGLGAVTKDAGGADSGDAGGDDDAADAGGDDDAADAGGDDAADSTDGGAASVGYRTVSRYLTLGASGPLSIALVAPGATSCATRLFVADVTLDPGKLSTVAIVGRPGEDAGDPPLAIVAFIDDRMTVADKARVRMVHTAFGTSGGRAPAGALAVRASGATTLPLAELVEPGKVAASSAVVPVDSLGYATIAPLPSPAQLAVSAAAGAGPTAPSDASADSWLSAAGELDLRGGTLHTGFILSSEDQPYEVLWCTDTATSGSRALCSIVR